MSQSLDLMLKALVDEERHSAWNQTPVQQVARLLDRVAGLFFVHGDALAYETAERMGVTPGEVWFEVVFPSVWGVLSTRCGILKRAESFSPLESVTPALTRRQLTTLAGRTALRMLPANWLERLLLPGFSGCVVLRRRPGDPKQPREFREVRSESSKGPLALCLLPFNLASIGALDIVHLLCYRQQRVVAKISEKVEFVGPHLEKIFEPLIRLKALQFVSGGPEVGSWLAGRPEFSHVHLTGSARTAAAVEQVVGRERLTSELGGVTAAIVLPDALSDDQRLRQTARQVAFGALANNGQHCVSFQLAFVPASKEDAFAQALWAEMTLAARRDPEGNGSRRLIDASSAKRLERLIDDAISLGARVVPEVASANQRHFPACLIQGINEKMRLLREEAFGPIVGLLALPDDDFVQQALRLAGSAELYGDLGISLFTSAPNSPETERIAAELRHGIVTVNTYPGVAFATSVAWGAGLQGLSGHGWVHNYSFVPEGEIEKVVLSTSLGRKGWGPIRWEDPWLLNLTGDRSIKVARTLVRLALAFFRKERRKLLSSLLSLGVALARRDWAARALDQRRQTKPQLRLGVGRGRR
jgi:acyl-CoA reductase-like NAD-dependent aldehyde dehydrogenase